MADTALTDTAFQPEGTMPTWWDQGLARARQAARNYVEDTKAGARSEVESAREIARQAGRAWKRFEPVHPSHAVHPPVPIESWLVSYDGDKLERNLDAYLGTLHPFVRDSEEAELRALMRSAEPTKRPESFVDTRYVERRKTVDLETPLFEFSAPDVAGAQIVVETSVTWSASSKWQFVLGAGGGPNRSTSMTRTLSFPASAGERKEIFIATKFEAVRRYEVRGGEWGGYFVPSNRQGFDEVYPITSGRQQPPTVRSLEAEDDVFGLFDGAGPHIYPRSELLDPYPLKRNKSGISEVRWNLEESRDYSVGSSGMALGIRFEAGVSIKLARSLALIISLPYGHDYELRLLTDRPGITWIVDP